MREMTQQHQWSLIESGLRYAQQLRQEFVAADPRNAKLIDWQGEFRYMRASVISEPLYNGTKEKAIAMLECGHVPTVGRALGHDMTQYDPASIEKCAAYIRKLNNTWLRQRGLM